MEKHIIRTIGLSLALGLTVAVTESAQARQGRGNATKQATETREEQETREKNQNAKGNKENQKENKSKDKQEREQRDRAQAQKGQNQPETDNSGKGNAYGQNKGDLRGREFGQNRAAEARMTGEQRRANLATTVDAGDVKVREARERIAKAKDDLEKNRRSGRMSDAELNERRAAIERAETAVRVLEERVNTGRARIAVQE